MVIHADRFGGIVEKVIGCDRGAPQRKGSMFRVCLLQVIELICQWHGCSTAGLFFRAISADIGAVTYMTEMPSTVSVT